MVLFTDQLLVGTFEYRCLEDLENGKSYLCVILLIFFFNFLIFPQDTYKVKLKSEFSY